MRNSKSAGSLAILLFTSLAFRPVIAADLGTESIEDLRKRLDIGGADAVAAEARRRLEEAGSADTALTTVLDLLNLLILADDVSGQGGGDEARASAEREVALTEGKAGPEPLLYARALADRGRVAMQAGDYKRARDDMQRALDLRETHGSEGDPAIGRLLLSLGTIDAGLGNLDGAQTLMERGLAAIEKTEGPESIRAGRALTNLGYLMIEKREGAKAVELLLRARTIFAKDPGEKSATFAKMLDNLAIAYEQTGDYVDARATYQQAIEALTALYPQGHPDIGAVMHDFGVMIYKMGDTRAAEDLTRRALASYEVLVGPEHPDTLRMMNSLAHYQHELGQEEEAEALLRKTLSVREKTIGPDHYDTAESLGDLGMFLVDRGDATAALPLLERALAVGEKALGPDHPVTATDLENLARCEAALGRRDAARAHFERALAIREARFGPDHPDVAGTLSGQAAFLFSGATPLEALPPAHRAAAILARQAREMIAGLPESQALLVVNGQPHPEEILFSGLLANAHGASVVAGEGGGGWLPACWEWVLARRGAVLDELAERNRRGLLAGTAEAQEAWRRLATARTRLARLWVNGGDDNPEVYRQALDQARGALDAAEIELARTSAVYKEVRADSQVGLEKVRRALPAGGALIEWVRVRAGGTDAASRTWHDIALVLGPGDAMRFADLGASVDIDAAVAAWRTALADAARTIAASSGGTAATDPLGQVTKRGEALRRRIWDPIASGLGGASRVYLVPDGTIHAVDFGALPDHGRYLIETGPSIQILSTGRDLVRYARSDAVVDFANRRGILAIGAPDFDATSKAQQVAMAKVHAGVAPDADAGATYRGAAPACLGPVRAHWQPIPASGREAERVAGLYRGHEPALALTGAAASETRFKQEAPGRRVLHLATHGFFIGETCAEGTDATRGTAASAGTPSENLKGASARNPLLQSGLVLAGANRRAQAAATSDDGILTAEELAALDLRAADLVVLSACDTGRGEVSVGEGIFGLRRALEIAGAHAVVMSLYPVPDRQAGRFMDRFYRARLDGRPIPDAARAASLQALEDLRRAERPAHPYYWGGFVTAGDWH
jgi:CHAT domain-containing protein/tetratricopeptide (TPR) repeat protein